ncbi:hypothetical protein LXL81_04995 [Dyadobacter sp. CY356]|nr:hypothetical protein [Dyadobacter sp. CY356]
MRQALNILVLLHLQLGCKKGTDIKPGEIEATVKGYVISDNWDRGCNSEGFVIKISADSYLISNSIPSYYENPSSWPDSGWIRYESASPDSCS